MMIFRIVGIFAVAMLMSACASQSEFSTQPAKPLVLEQTLVGRVLGEGTLTNSVTGGETKFSVVINGSWDGKVLTLVEDFTYSDGAKDRKTWHLTKVSNGRYQGTREDVIGTADVRQDGQGVRLDYYVTLETSIGKLEVRFRDLLYLQDDGSVANKATVSKFGLRIGRVDIVMRRDAGESPLSVGSGR